MTRQNLFRILYLAALYAIGFSLPLSVWFISLFTILLLIFWIAGEGWRNIPLLLKEKKSVLIFLFFYMVYLLWMINTSDLIFGLKELRIKLPLFVFPLVIGLSKPLSSKELKQLLSFFIAGVVVSTVAGVAMKIIPVWSGISDTRELSLFISHIRLALMTVAAIFCAGWYLFSTESKTFEKILFGTASIWLTVFLFLLLSVTGIMVFFVMLLISIILLIRRSGKTAFRYLLGLFLFLIFAGCTLYIIHEIKSFYKPGNSFSFPPDELTINGRGYQHNNELSDIENGNKVWIYINEEELKEGWNRCSHFSYDSIDRKGQTLKYTLIRYMTSAGLRKDSLGVSALSAADVSNIENGMTNRLFSQGRPIKSKIYEIIWQIDFNTKGGNPSGNSITQRMEFLKTGWHIFLRAPFFGSGTGDIANEYDLQYNLDKSMLDKSHRLLAHNQYLTFLISFGIIGFLIICASIFFPVVKARITSSYIPMTFCLILFISMLGEDTLETHTGVTFFAYFYSVFIFGKDNG